MNNLIAEILKAQDSLQTIEFKFAEEDYKFYFRYLTLLEKARIEQMCIKTVTTIDEHGKKVVSHEKQDHLQPIHIILEKALDEDGKRLYSHTNREHFDAISKLPAGLASFIALKMSMDVMGNLKGNEDGE